MSAFSLVNLVPITDVPYWAVCLVEEADRIILKS